MRGHVRALKYLLLSKVLIILLLLHSKLVVHLLATLANIFAFTEVIHMSQALPWLPLRLGQNVLDLRVILWKLLHHYYHYHNVFDHFTDDFILNQLSLTEPDVST